jgi:hypothetical protein
LYALRSPRIDALLGKPISGAPKVCVITFAMWWLMT